MGRAGLVREGKGSRGSEDHGRVLGQAGMGKTGHRSSGVSERQV